MDWQPIETAPKDGTSVLLWDGEFQFTGEWMVEAIDGSHWWIATLHGQKQVACDPQPTHWHPLPPPPTPRAGEGRTG